MAWSHDEAWSRVRMTKKGRMRWKKKTLHSRRIESVCSSRNLDSIRSWRTAFSICGINHRLFSLFKYHIFWTVQPLNMFSAELFLHISSFYHSTRLTFSDRLTCTGLIQTKNIKLRIRHAVLFASLTSLMASSMIAYELQASVRSVTQKAKL